MGHRTFYFAMAIVLLLLAALRVDAADNGATVLKQADKPLYTDPIYNGSTDPMVCYNKQAGKWYMYYTSRRSNVQGLGGIESIHGTPIGIAESSDGGATWRYLGNCNIDYHPDDNPTYWAPEVIEYEGTYHMYLTYVPGIFDSWDHPRDIVHLTSPNGIDWTTQSVLKLAVRKVIDACVFRLDDGTWRMWYNNERDGKSIYYADSHDLYNWTDKGKVTSIQTVGEGPNVIFWHGRYYMLVDEWKGLSIFSSDDAMNWKKQDEYILNGVQGSAAGARGNHADVEVVGDKAYIFYFGNRPQPAEALTDRSKAVRGSAVYVAELKYNADGTISCDTEAPCLIDLGTR